MIPRAALVRIAPWWLLCLVVGSFIPGKGKEALGTISPKNAPPEVRIAATITHQLVHFVAFGVTAAIFVLLAGPPAGRVAAAAGTTALGLAIESAQYKLLALDAMEWWDVRDDAIAAFAVLAVMQWTKLRSALITDGTPPTSDWF